MDLLDKMLTFETYLYNIENIFWKKLDDNIVSIEQDLTTLENTITDIKDFIATNNVKEWEITQHCIENQLAIFIIKKKQLTEQLNLLLNQKINNINVILSKNHNEELFEEKIHLIKKIENLTKK